MGRNTKLQKVKSKLKRIYVMLHTNKKPSFVTVFKCRTLLLNSLPEAKSHEKSGVNK